MNRLRLLFVLVVVLVLMLSASAYAQSTPGTDPLPTNLDDLLGPAGLGVVVVIAMGFLKKAGKFGKWITAAPLNGFAISLALSGLILGIVHAVKYFGIYDEAQNVWINFGVMWLVAQAWYNTQKAASAGIRSVLGD